MTFVSLVRYGVISEVARFRGTLIDQPARGEPVVIETHRGTEVGTLLQVVESEVASKGAQGNPPTELRLVRVATADDRARHALNREEAQQAWANWQERIAGWNLALELVDLEWTLDRQKLILYVLGGRGADTTRLALHAATLGETVVEVQPVGAEGVIPLSAGEGGCGSGGCGCHE